MAAKLGSGAGDNVVSLNPNADARREQSENVKPATFLEACRDIAKVNAEMRSLNERRKGIRKKWKAEGIELGILDATLKMAEWDRAEVRTHFDNARKYAEWLGLPVGVQADLFKGLGDDEVQKAEWRALGRVASNLGRPAKPPEDCPPEYQQAWLQGFNDEDEAAWSEAERNEAQTAAAATIDPAKPGNIADVAKALDAKPAGPKKKPAGKPTMSFDDNKPGKGAMTVGDLKPGTTSPDAGAGDDAADGSSPEVIH